MSDDHEPVQAPVPADFGAPDRILYGLTARQVAILAATGALLWAAYHALTPTVAPAAFAVGALPVAGLAAVLALGRRDGIGMDRFVAAALAGARSPRRLVPAPEGVPAAPSWVAAVAATSRRMRGPGRDPVAGVAPLRLPAAGIAASGVVDADAGPVALTAATTVNFDLRASHEQHALVAGMGQWLNALSHAVQVVVSTRRADLHARADAIDERLGALPHPALADAAAGYARFLRELAAERDPLDRHVLVAHRAGPGAATPLARRQAEATARAWAGLGAATRVLHGGQVTDALVGACHPWRHVGTGRATPAAVIGGRDGGGR
jgi:hypothetical protein